MRGSDVTPEQMEKAKLFLELCIFNRSPPEPHEVISTRYEDMIRFLAWYGAIRYKAALDGVGELDKPGLAEEV